MTTDKRTEELKVRLSAELKLALMELAADDDRALGEYLYLVLERHAWGHVKRACRKSEGPDRP